MFWLSKVLLKTSSNASLVDSSRRTALHWAVHHGHIACAKWGLVANKLLFIETSGWSWTRASPGWTGRPETRVGWQCCTLLRGTVPRSFYRWLTKGFLEPIFTYLLTKLLLGKFSINRENVDVKDINKRTPLHWAAAHGCYDQVQLRFALTPCAIVQVFKKWMTPHPPRTFTCKLRILLKQDTALLSLVR